MSLIKYQAPPKEILIDMHINQKKSRTYIEEFFGVTGPVVNRWFKEYNIKFIGRKDRSRPTIETLIDLHVNQKKTIQEISQIYNTAQRYVTLWFNYYNIEIIRYRKKRKLKVSKEQLISMHHESEMSLKEISERLGVSDVIVGSWFEQFDIEKKIFNKNSPTSKAEIQILEFVRSIGFDPIKTRTVLPNRLELDVYIPEKKFAIEHCGLYWHNDNRLPASYHAVKHQYATINGLTLFTLFEDEWIERKPIVKSMILGRLGVSKKIGARKCQVKPLDIETAKSFFRQTHLQGAPNKIKIAFGLFFNDILISCMSFGDHPRRTNYNEVILQRFSSILNTVVVGGASKLFKYAITDDRIKNRNIITWSDNRYSTGNVYKQLGFIKDQELPCDYYYVKRQQRFPKQRFQKRFTNCPKDKTEYQFALENGYSRIWDCGKIRWLKTFNNNEQIQK